MSTPRRPHKLTQETPNNQRHTTTSQHISMYKYTPKGIYILCRYVALVSPSPNVISQIKLRSKFKNVQLKTSTENHKPNMWITLSSVLFKQRGFIRSTSVVSPTLEKGGQNLSQVDFGTKTANAIGCSSDPRLGLSETLL